MKFEEQLLMYIKGGFPLMICETVEVERAALEIREIVKRFNTEVLPKPETNAEDWLKKKGLGFYTWDVHNGMIYKEKSINDTEDPKQAMEYIVKSTTDAGVFIIYNLHLFWDDVLAKPQILQMVRELYAHGKISYKHIIMIGNGRLPIEFQPYFVTLDFPLPGRDEMDVLVKQCIDGIGMKVSDSEVRAAAEAALGMTSLEVSGAVCIAAMAKKCKGLDRDVLFEEKAKVVKRSGLLEYISTDETLDTVGGLNTLKGWFVKIAKAYKESEKATKYHLPTAKGCLIVGIPGSGKTLSAKAIASLFGVKLFRCDPGRMFGGIVGETESNTRALFRLIDAVSPCVVLLDEVDKVMVGLESSGASDAGVTSRFIGSMLYYLQEKESKSFFVFTANNVDRLDPALMRKGRIDEIWFVDMPVDEEREEILKIHLKKVGRDYKKFDLKKLIGLSNGLTGAEIESAIKAAMYEAFSEDREFLTEDICNALQESISVVDTKSEEIGKLRAWAKNRARVANESLLLEKKAGKRKIITEDDKHWMKS